MAEAIVERIAIHPLSIPMRRRAGHAAAGRVRADPIVVSVELRTGVMGYGEAAPCPDVSGESVDSVLATIQDTFAPALVAFHTATLPDALEFLEALPWQDRQGRWIQVARAAIELALLDAVLRQFHRNVDDIVQWMGLPGFGPPGSLGSIRYGGVLSAPDLPAMQRQLRILYWYGLRDFKLEVGLDNDIERLRHAVAYLARPLRRGQATLRVDAHGSWTLAEAVEWNRRTADLPITVIEQPLAKGYEAALPALHSELGSAPLPRALMHDESLITIEDARRLVEARVADGFNLRINRCGGLLPTLRLAALARRHGVRILLGGILGEMSILSAAGLRFLEACPGVEWAEGCFGRILLQDDISPRSLRYGYGGRPPRLFGFGLGTEVSPAKLNRWAAYPPTILNL